jgi:sugar/nucleoside kinase (ribokinase family)
MVAGRSVFACGYVAMDVTTLGGSVRQRAGGSATNVAANLAHLGWNSSLIGRLGADAAGRRVSADLRRSGVDTSFLELSPELETPVVVHAVDPPGHRFAFSCPDCGRSFPKHRPVTPALRDAALSEAVANPPDVFFFDRSSAPALLMARVLKEKGVLIVFEPSSKGVRDRTLGAAEVADVLKSNSEDLEPALKEALFQPRSHQLQIESLGSEGLRYRQGTSKWRVSRGRPVPVVDTAGAGDWLTAAVLDALVGQSSPLHLEADLEPLFEEAQAFAALNCCYVGARALAELAPHRAKEQLMGLMEGVEPFSSRRMWRRKSRAQGVCSMCLGPLAEPSLVGPAPVERHRVRQGR